MTLHVQADVLEVVYDLAHVAKVRGLAVAQQQEPIEHVEHLRRRLMNGDHDGLGFLRGIALQGRDQRGGRVRVQARSWFVQQHDRGIRQQFTGDIRAFLLAT